MRLCILGKYPPIQGGVSSETFWLARRLAERGHEVHVVTNAPEVEPAFRVRLGPGDAAWLEPSFDSGGTVTVHSTSPDDERPGSHVPSSNPFVSKLAGLAAEVVEAHACDRVLAYYFEPYAIAGWLAAQWTGRPLVVKHAGSDLDRLMRVPELAAAYKRMLRSAETVVTTRGLMARFLGIGVERRRLAAAPRLPIPREVFDPTTRPLELDDDDGVPRIGIYGKIGRAKGTVDLMVALGRLADEGLDFTLAALIGPDQGEALAPLLVETGLEERARVLPLLPPWRVGSFIRSCAAVCFLERDFPVAIHGPMVPREVLASGTCLVLSEEIAERQVSGERFEDGGNVLLADPHDHDGLAAALRRVVLDPAEAAAIGAAGNLLSRAIEPADEYAADWEAILDGAVEGRAEIEAPAAVDLVAPALVTAAKEQWPAFAEELAGVAGDHDPYAVAVDWCERLSSHVAGLEAGEPRSRLAACCRFERRRLGAASDLEVSGGPVPTRGSRVRVNPADGSLEAELIPVLAASVQIETFDYDVTALAADGDPGAVAAMPGEPVTILFRRAPHLTARELRIDAATCALLDLCDGENDVDAIVAAMATWFGAEREDAEEGVRAAIVQLRDADVLELLRPEPGPARAVGTAAVGGLA